MRKRRKKFDMKKKHILFLTLALTMVLGTTACSSNQKPDQQSAPAQESQTQPSKQWDKPPAMQINENKTYIAHIDTNKGKITVQLFPKEAPKAVNNFVFLAREKFYDGVIFHRIIKNFMIQTGDPLGNGTGGPGYHFAVELPTQHKYEPGIVAMANAGPDTNGSQFFIGNGKGVESLNSQPNYTIFGKVIDGMDTVEKISNTPVKVGSESVPSVPTEKVFIKTITIEEK
jgi:cyclophilin family peptidyl-prolyl cis-trans isomerase